MKTDVRFRGILDSSAVRDHVVRRLHFRFSRFSHAIGSIVVRLADENGPRGGVDKRCRVTVRGPALGAVTVDEAASNAYGAIDVALERAARSVARALGRKHRLETTLSS